VLGHRSVPIARQNYRFHFQMQTWSLIAPVWLSIEVGCSWYLPLAGLKESALQLPQDG